VGVSLLEVETDGDYYFGIAMPEELLFLGILIVLLVG